MTLASLPVTTDLTAPDPRPHLALVQPHVPWARTAAALRGVLTQDVRCRRRWQRHVHRYNRHGLNQAAVAMVIALELWDRGDIPESHRELPRSLKDRVSRALSGKLISGDTLRLFVAAFDLNEEQEAQLYAAWEVDGTVDTQGVSVETGPL